MKKFIFLDVDSTLIYYPKEINTALIDTLVKSGITEVYLFTNMNLNDIEKQGKPKYSDSHISRYVLIQEMANKGIKVLGVITPADPEYRDEQGNIKPIGSAYRELYEPLMQRVINEKEPLDLENYTSNHEILADYYLNAINWLKPHVTSYYKSDWYHNEETIVAPSPCVFSYNKQGKIVELLKTKQDFLEYFKHHKNKEDSKLQIVYGPSRGGALFGDYTETQIIKADIADKNKALMMRVAIEQLTRCYGPIAILFFDDNQKYLNSCQEEVKRWNKEFNNRPVLLHTHLMKADFNEANSNVEKAKYANALINFQIQTFSVQSKEDVSNAIIKHRKFYRKSSTRNYQINLINNNFNHFTANDWLNLAIQAEKGSSPLFNKKTSLIAAYQCFILSIYAAPKNQLNIALNNLQIFLQKNDYLSFIDSKTTHKGIEDFLFNLEKPIRHGISHNPYAQELCRRKLAFLQKVKSQYPKLDSKQEGNLSVHENALLKMILFYQSQLEKFQAPEVTSTMTMTSTLTTQTTTVVPKDVQSQTSKHPSKKITYEYGRIPPLTGIIHQVCNTNPDVATALMQDAKKAKR